MFSFKQYLDERRRNPELNPRRDEIAVLKKYARDPDIYISFNNRTEINLNARASYITTPLGIYFYPLKLGIDFYNVYMERGRPLDFPFAYDRKYIQVVKHVKGKVLHTDKYNRKEFKKDVIKLMKMDTPSKNPDMVDGVFLRHVTPDFVRSFGKKGDTRLMLRSGADAVKSLLDLTEALSSSQAKWISQAKWSKLILKLGYVGVVDTGKEIIHPNEPCQAVFFDKRAFKKIDIIDNKKTFLSTDNVWGDQIEVEEVFSNMDRYVLSTAKTRDGRTVLVALDIDNMFDKHFIRGFGLNDTLTTKQIDTILSKLNRVTYMHDIVLSKLFAKSRVNFTDEQMKKLVNIIKGISINTFYG